MTHLTHRPMKIGAFAMTPNRPSATHRAMGHANRLHCYKLCGKMLFMRSRERALNLGADTMTKHQQSTINTTLSRLPALGADYAARVLSALHRSAMRATQQREIAAIAAAHELTRSPNWIV